MAVCLTSLVSTSAQSMRSRLFVYATDRSGAPVGDLTASDFDVKSGSEHYQIVSVRHGADPVRIIVMLDDSNAAIAELDAVRHGLQQFVGELPSGIEVGLVTVGGSYSVRLAPTSDRPRFLRGLSGVHGETTAAATHLTESLLKATDELLEDAAIRWPVFVIVTTNAAEDTTRVRQIDFDRFSGGLVENGASVHAVLLGGAANSQSGRMLETMVQNLTKDAGGLCTSAESARAISDALVAIGKRIARDQEAAASVYEVEYVGPSAATGHGIELGVSRDGVALAPSLRRTPQ
jgi:hypothetical protein